MFSRSHTRTTWLILLVAALAFPASAMANGHSSRQIVLHRSGAVISLDPHGTQARYDAQDSKFGLFGSAASPSLPPDRVDQLGTANGPRPVQVATVTTASSTGFDWTAAIVGAGAGIVLGLLAMAGISAGRNRRGGVAVS